MTLNPCTSTSIKTPSAPSASPSTPTTITISTKSTQKTLAERALLDILITDSGHSKQTVASNVVTAVHTVQSHLDALTGPRLENGDISPDKPITFYSIESMSMDVRDYYDNETHQLDPERKVYTAESSISVHFRDFQVLGQIVVELSSTPHVNLRGVQWTLTEAKKAWLEEETRLQALRAAMERAGNYARVIGREGGVRVARILDGEEEGGGNYRGMPAMMMARKAPGGGDVLGAGVMAGIDFTPRMVEVSGGLKVEFIVE
jgi:uncharacterized protein YggE